MSCMRYFTKIRCIDQGTPILVIFIQPTAYAFMVLVTLLVTVSFSWGQIGSHISIAGPKAVTFQEEGMDFNVSLTLYELSGAGPYTHRLKIIAKPVIANPIKFGGPLASTPYKANSGKAVLMDFRRAGSLTLAVNDTKGYFLKEQEIRYKATNKDGTEKNYESKTGYDRYGDKYKPHKSLDSKQVKTGEWILGWVPVAGDLYSTIQLGVEWMGKAEPKWGVVTETWTVTKLSHLDTNSETYKTFEKYAGSDPLFANDRQFDFINKHWKEIKHVRWHSLVNPVWGSELNYFFALKSEGTKPDYLYIRTSLPYSVLTTKGNQSRLAKKQIEIEWKAPLLGQKAGVGESATPPANLETGNLGPVDVATLKGYTAICTDGGDFRSPEVYGNMIAWAGKREQDKDLNIFAWDPENGMRVICDAPRTQMNIAIYGSTIVWQDERNWGNSRVDIYAWDPVNGERCISNAARSQAHPAIHGKTIVWSDSRNANKTHWDIYAWDPVNGERPVCTANGIQSTPDIYGETIVWADNRGDNSDIYGWSPEKGEFAICTADRDQIHPSIWGDTVVWQDRRNGAYWDIYAWSPTKGEWVVSQGKWEQQSADIWGQTIVWTDNRREPYNYAKIYAWDSTYGERLIWSKKTGMCYVRISGSTLVWQQDGKDRKGDIKAYFGWDTVMAEEKKD